MWCICWGRKVFGAAVTSVLESTRYTAWKDSKPKLEFRSAKRKQVKGNKLRKCGRCKCMPSQKWHLQRAKHARQTVCASECSILSVQLCHQSTPHWDTVKAYPVIKAISFILFSFFNEWTHVSHIVSTLWHHSPSSVLLSIRFQDTFIQMACTHNGCKSHAPVSWMDGNVKVNIPYIYCLSEVFLPSGNTMAHVSTLLYVPILS